MKLPLESITVKGRRAIGPGQRFRILHRDKHACRYCGQSAPDVVLEVDHVIPVSAGGRNDDSNLVTSCRECNVGKSDSMDQLRALWGEEEYREAIARVIEQRDESQVVAAKIAAEAESRYRLEVNIPGLPEVVS